MVKQRRSTAIRGRAGPSARRLHGIPSDSMIPEDSPVVMASVDEVLAALEGVDLDRPWTAIRHQVIPVLPRWRPLPGAGDEPIIRSWPPGLETQFGLDLGPAFLYIGAWALGHWGVSVDQLAHQAIDNLRARVAGRALHPLVDDSVGGVPITAFQSRDGWASALLLAPDLLTRIFGPDPALVLAPMRDLVIQVPADTDPELAAWLLEEFSSLDPNGLAVPVLAFAEGRLSFVSPAGGGPRGTRARPH